MTVGRAVTVRLRVPVRTKRGRAYMNGGAMRSTSVRCRRHRRRCIRGGFLPALIPLLAAAISAVPGIASVALQAAQKH